MAIGNFLTTDEVADELGVSPGRVHQFVTDGRLKISQRLGNILLFDRKDVEKFGEIPRIPGRPKSEK